MEHTLTHSLTHFWRACSLICINAFHYTHDLPELNEGDTVGLKPFVLRQKERKKGVVVERLDERSYEVEKADGSSYRRNRAHLKKTNESRPEATSGES